VTAPVNESWDRIEAWLAANAPATFASLRPPAAPAIIAAAEAQLGITFPPDLVATLRRHDGVVSDRGFSVPYGYPLQPLDQIVAETLRLRRSCRLAAVVNAERHIVKFERKREELLVAPGFWHPKWVLLSVSLSGDYLVLDQRPGPAQGRIGEVIHDSVGGFELWPSLAVLLDRLADALEHGTPLRDQLGGSGWVPSVSDSGRLEWTVDEAADARPQPPDR
jgi:cell wall assembly regulator SMI1